MSAASEITWLDLHFQAAQAEYEESLRWVGVRPGWSVLDAGCGGGDFLPLMSALVGAEGDVTALDLEPENIAHVNALVRDGRLPGRVRAQVGSLFDLPFGPATFDAAWCANVMQFMTEAELARVLAEFRRAVRPGGLVTIKEMDASVLHYLPISPDVIARLVAARRAKAMQTGALGSWCGSVLPARLRQAGFADVRRRGWLVERWAPLPPVTRRFVENALAYLASIAADFALPEPDLAVWRDVATDPAALVDDPDFCFREFFVVTVGRVP